MQTLKYREDGKAPAETRMNADSNVKIAGYPGGNFCIFALFRNSHPLYIRG